MKLCLLDIDSFDEDRSIMRLFCKDSSGKSVICLDYGFEPYFYILSKKGKEVELKEKLEGMGMVKRTEMEDRTVSGDIRKFVKVFCLFSSDVHAIREIVKEWEIGRGGSGIVEEEYEYNMTLYRQYLLAKQISGMGFIDIEGDYIKKDYNADIVLKIKSIKPAPEGILKSKVLAFDIETVEDDGRQKIAMLSMKSQALEKVLTYRPDVHYGKYVEVLKDEKELIERFVQIVKDEGIDVIVGYNSDMFDMHVIRQRAEELKVRLDISRDKSELKFARRAKVSAARFKGVVHVDLFEFINNIMAAQMQTEVMSLDEVSAELLGDSKIEVQYEELIECWRKSKDLARMAEYCLKDSDLTLRLGEFILPQIYQLARLCGQPLFDTARMTYSQLVEWYLSKKAYLTESIIPNQPKWDEIFQRRSVTPYEGGFVKEPIAGLHESIAVMDFRSLYPSIIATFNISPETLNCQDCRKDGYEVPGTKYWFCKRKNGFVSSAIKELIERRAKIKKKIKGLQDSGERNRLEREQAAIKTVANATYGYFGFAGSKWYCRECALSSAAFGRFYIKKVIDEATSEGFTVIYVDTDSMFVKTKGNIKKKTKAFLEKMNKALPGIMELNLQGFYKRGLFIPKGVGIGTAKKRYALIDEDGVLTIRGLEKVRRDWSMIAKDTQEAVLKMVLSRKDVKGAVRYTQDIIRKIRQGKVPLKELTLHEQLAKPLSQYQVTGPHIVAARKAKERGRPIGEGMIIIFAITKGKASISQRAEPIEDVKIEDVDTNYYINNQVLPAAMRVLAVMGVSEEQILGVSLKSFVK